MAKNEQARAQARGDSGEKSPKLGGVFFVFFFNFHSYSTSCDDIEYYHCILFLLKFNGYRMCNT